MRKLLSLFSVLTFSTVSVTSVVACTETETEAGWPWKKFGANTYGCCNKSSLIKFKKLLKVELWGGKTN